jgi:hypothetical protein
MIGYLIPVAALFLRSGRKHASALGSMLPLNALSTLTVIVLELPQRSS